MINMGNRMQSRFAVVKVAIAIFATAIVDSMEYETPLESPNTNHPKLNVLMDQRVAPGTFDKDQCLSSTSQAMSRQYDMYLTHENALMEYASKLAMIEQRDPDYFMKKLNEAAIQSHENAQVSLAHAPIPTISFDIQNEVQLQVPLDILEDFATNGILCDTPDMRYDIRNGIRYYANKKMRNENTPNGYDPEIFYETNFVPLKRVSMSIVTKIIGSRPGNQELNAIKSQFIEFVKEMVRYENIDDSYSMSELKYMVQHAIETFSRLECKLVSIMRAHAKNRLSYAHEEQAYWIEAHNRKYARQRYLAAKHVFTSQMCAKFEQYP